MKLSFFVKLLTLFIMSNLFVFNGVAEAALQCNRCHGTNSTGDMRPEDYPYRNISSGGFVGNHRTHMAFGATPVTCAKCHQGSAHYSSAHRDGNIRLSAYINNSRQPTPYNNRTTPWPQTATPSLNNSCNSVNCHFEKPSPNWGSNSADTTCSTCHSTPPSDGSHGKKHGLYFGSYTTSCSKCHPNHLLEANVFSHATSAGKRPLTVSFTTFPNSGGTYSGGSVSYPDYLKPSSSRNGTCSDIYCHSDGRGGAAVKNPPLTWSDTRTTDCYSCHRGRKSDSTQENCDGFGVWSSSKGYCTPDLTMNSNGHHRLVGPQWIRKYPCSYCHNSTVDAAGTVKDMAMHVNGAKDISMSSQWNIVGRPAASYNREDKTCDNVYCHSDGTTDPEKVRSFAWTAPKTDCNTCHGHSVEDNCASTNCHDNRIDANGKKWTTKTGWPVGKEWMAAMPMFPNTGAGTARANSHTRHSLTDFTCDNCHAATVVNGSCLTCHAPGIPPGGMGEVAHINPDYHVNKTKDVVFKDGGSYGAISKVCSGTKCHANGTDPVWGGSVNAAVTCLACHGTSGRDRDTYQSFNGYTQARINLTQFYTTGHGRYSSSGHYPVSDNPAANFTGNPCWYCHDNNVLHKDSTNPFRLRKHYQYENRFSKECAYCHMEGVLSECLGCHNESESLAPQLTSPAVTAKHLGLTRLTGCGKNEACHFDNGTIHKTNNEKFWTAAEKNDVKNQYVMMGVCLQCHDDDSSNQCTSCHTAPEGNPLKYSLGFNPGVEGSRLVRPKKARASASHFGYKHYRAYTNEGIWRGGKFCWDCHDPHGDSNIYMIHDKVATTTDGVYGVPLTRSDVVFTRKQSGLDYARTSAPYNGICNVCHTPESKHYTSVKGDGHNASRVCTTCHEHRFADSHANKQNCNTAGCHDNKKPVPKHTAFGLPRDCTKCHAGTIGMRMDVMGQLRSNSHHIQRLTGEIRNTDCYQCHWEANVNGLINVQYHEGYNYFNYSTSKNKKVDLVIYGAGVRPTVYRNNSSAVQFTAASMGLGIAAERAEVSKVSSHCLSCHSDKNNSTIPFDDCKTPLQYAWDRSSVAGRYSQTGTTTWGKYAGTATAARKNIGKALSAHGNATANGGGWSTRNGTDGDIPNTRDGSYAVQCFDCHNSHGSKAVGTTSSYVTFNGTRNGANLKETQAGKGGYAMTYKASANSDASSVNPYNTGAGQCFDCHETRNSGTTPWGYSSTFGAVSSVIGYKDTPRFGQGTKGSTQRFDERMSRKTILGGHLKASEPAGSLSGLAKDAGMVSTSSTSSLTDGSKNWTPADKWKNFHLLVVDGSSSGQLRKITASTTTSLTFEPFASALAAGNTYRIVPYSATINGLCTPCHDPHGVSLTFGADQPYAVPLLKGTWMTSPYKEDSPPPDPFGDKVRSAPYGQSTPVTGAPLSWGDGMYQQNHPSPYQPQINHNIDRNTFGASAKIAENDDRFAGLCLNCHNKASLTDGVNRNDGAAGFKTIDRVHESVKGWGVNSEHSFPCAKCHQSHNSGLPRLLQTNCLDSKHRGGRVSGGLPWSADQQDPWSAHSQGAEHRGFPIGNIYGNTIEATTACHVSRFGPTYSPDSPSSQWPDGNLWNNVTPW